MDMNGGDSESVHSLRFSEMKMAANCFKHDIITVKSDKDHALATLINEIKPDFIFVPHYIDWHPEHIEVMKLLASSLENINTDRLKIVMYQVSCPILYGITHALPMTKKEWKRKWMFFKEHYPSQLYISHQRFSLNEVINGKYIKEKFTRKKTADIDEVVPKGKYFVLGDNRPNSLDSEEFGAVSSKEILGKTKLALLPPRHFGNKK